MLEKVQNSDYIVAIAIWDKKKATFPQAGDRQPHYPYRLANGNAPNNKNRDYFLPNVLIPKRIYNGQKPIIAVRVKTPARIPITIAHVPVIIPLMIRIAARAAKTSRIILSANPIFAFIIDSPFKKQSEN